MNDELSSCKLSRLIRYLRRMDSSGWAGGSALLSPATRASRTSPAATAHEVEMRNGFGVSGCVQVTSQRRLRRGVEFTV